MARPFEALDHMVHEIAGDYRSKDAAGRRGA